MLYPTPRTRPSRTTSRTTARSPWFRRPCGGGQALSEFAKTSKLLEVRHGSLEGKVLSSAQIEELAKLPSKEQLLGQLLGTMNAVPTNLVSLMANMIRPLLYALKAIEEKKQA